jgi:hypothetical protein
MICSTNETFSLPEPGQGIPGLRRPIVPIENRYARIIFDGFVTFPPSDGVTEVRAEGPINHQRPFRPQPPQAMPRPGQGMSLAPFIAQPLLTQGARDRCHEGTAGTSEIDPVGDAVDDGSGITRGRPRRHRVRRTSPAVPTPRREAASRRRAVRRGPRRVVQIETDAGPARFSRDPPHADQRITDVTARQTNGQFNTRRLDESNVYLAPQGGKSPDLLDGSSPRRSRPTSPPSAAANPGDDSWLGRLSHSWEGPVIWRPSRALDFMLFIGWPRAMNFARTPSLSMQHPRDGLATGERLRFGSGTPVVSDSMSDPLVSADAAGQAVTSHRRAVRQGHSLPPGSFRSCRPPPATVSRAIIEHGPLKRRHCK